ncbi:MAG: DUF3343 domain-containing protein [Anaerolineae bacterium]|nr:DUF3343 domain-containing protein [Anaerolineae bacterium]MDW8068405.1 DUF3343 domain-containing protein [Anaerolineae bacterium]
MYAVILLPSTSHAIRAEKILREAGIDCQLVPIPRHLSSDCGICVRIPRQAREAARAALEQARLDIESIHDLGA